MADWIEKSVDHAAVEALVAAGYPRLLARLLALRGVTVDSADEYFSPDWRRFPPPETLPGIELAAAEIFKAIEAHKKIVVFGDYDCDGFCATAIVFRTVRALGGTVVPFIPKRIPEGYGMTAASIGRMLREIPQIGLIVTVDNGIGSEKEISFLKEQGIPVIVTDHHLPSDRLPTSAVVYVNPKVTETQTPERLQNLCGAGVAYFLSNALVSRAREARGDASLARGLSGILFTLAGLATVTDIMPLRGVNRIFVYSALSRFNDWAPAGLKALLVESRKKNNADQDEQQVNFDDEPELLYQDLVAYVDDKAETDEARTPMSVNAKDFSFALGPRINACGRLKDGVETLALLLVSSLQKAGLLARLVSDINKERKTIEQRMTDLAMKLVVDDAAGQVIDLGASSESIHPGVAGIVAARVLEKLANQRGDLGVPVCVLVDGKGSCRAPAGYNVRNALAACSDELTHFGGHVGAAGLGVKEGRMDCFRERFCMVCAEQFKTLPPETRSACQIDAWVNPDEVTLELAEKVREMEPFGEGNPEPIFALRGVPLAEVRSMGNSLKHLQVFLDGKTPLRGVWWNHGDDAESLRASASNTKDIMFTLGISTFGEPHVEMRVIAIR